MADLPQTKARGYEPSNASVRAVLWVAAAFLAMVAVSAVLIGGLLRHFEVARSPAPVSPLERVELVPPAPRLEVRPLETLDQVRRREDELLGGYGWVDREHEVARIPIDRAMAILAGRGWPERPEGDPDLLRHAPPVASVAEPREKGR